jgi:predicted NBD/HSP70 family sugar kinase
MSAAFMVKSKFVAPLDPGFVPAALWNRRYRELVAADPSARRIGIALVRDPGSISLHIDRVLSANHAAAGQTLLYMERLLKFLLWQKGAHQVLIAGADEITRQLAVIYHPHGARAFDEAFVGPKLYRQPLTIEARPFSSLPATVEPPLRLGRNLDGCRIGFDLGGSDRKAAALIDGEVVFSEEIAWSPYFESDPAYHVAGVQDTLLRAAAHLPRVDAIGGSAAGTYVNNEVRAASLFRGVPADRFEGTIRRMFFDLQARWGGVPFEVANDGEVTALAGSLWLKANAVLGISLGTSQAAGYVTPEGFLTPWLNELAFAPVDYRPDAPRDEWSGDAGCGVQYFSQQAVSRLAGVAGFGFPADMALPEQLVAVQAAMKKGDPRARAIYETIGTYLGYTVAHYAGFYEIRNLLLLGRVTSGDGGAVMLERAAVVLRGEFPELAEGIRFHTPTEADKRHGQAVAAASLPTLPKTQAP